MENNTTGAPTPTGDGEPTAEKTTRRSGINQRHFAMFYLFLTVLLIFVVYRYFDPADSNSPSFGTAIRISTTSMQSVVLWFLSSLGFAAALNGLSCNLYDEIIEQHNVAASIILGFAWLSLAVVIHG